MKEPDAYDTIIAVFTKPEKKKMLVLTAVFVAIIICGIAVAVLVQSPAGSGATPPPGQGISGLPGQAPNPSSPPQETPDARLTVPQTDLQTQTEPAPDAEKKPVDFVLEPEARITCGLTCRALTATITNTGSETAHNVCITLVVRNSRDEIIFLNGAPSISQCVGDIAGGASKSEPITINADCGAFASRCIGQTLTLLTRATSDEKTVQFPDQAIAV
jgi:hypothetical protein